MRKVIIDTDLGVDDAWAVSLALTAGDLDILGFTTVFGNIEANQAAVNTMHILELVGRTSIPVFSGSEGPILPLLDPSTGAPRPPNLLPGKEVHGPKGLGSYQLPDVVGTPERNAVEWLVEAVNQGKGTIDVVAIGPLTNIALACRVNPDFVKNTRKLIFMGGVTDGPGNVLPLSTANIWNDPEAALIVFHAGFEDIVMVGQDVTRYARVTEEVEERMRNIGSKYAEFLLHVSDTYAKKYRGFEPTSPGFPFHDFLAVAYLIDSGAFKTEKLYVTVETTGRITRGQTVADRRQRSQSQPQMTVCVEVDVDRVFDNFLGQLKKCN